MLSSIKSSETTRTRCKAWRWKWRNWVTACCPKRQLRMKSRCWSMHGRTTLDRKCLTWRCLIKMSFVSLKMLFSISQIRKSSFSFKLSRSCKLSEKTWTWALVRKPLMQSKASSTLSSIQGSTSLTDQELLTLKRVNESEDKIVAKQETFWLKLFMSRASYSNTRARNAS